MVSEETLDPKDWEELRRLGHRMLDDMIDRHRDIREIPAQGSPPPEALGDICVPLPSKGEGEERVYRVFQRSILPYGAANSRPRSWGLVAGTGSPFGMLAAMLTAGYNSYGESPTSASGRVHNQVVDWIKEMIDYPEEAGGVLVSGGSEANFTALAVARNARAEIDVKTNGIQNVPRTMTVYVGDGGHHCLERSVELLGIGGGNLRWIPSDSDCRIDIGELKKAIANDRGQGRHPFCLIGNAGTVDTGAFDDLNAMADIASREKMWFHVDAAFGGWVRMSKSHRRLADGLERADSVAIDLHKWMYMPYGIGCTLVKDKLAHYSTFVYGHEAKYLKTAFDRVKEQGDVLRNPHNLALPLSREFPSLKAYMLLRAHGKEKYGRLIQQNLDQANYLGDLLKSEPDIELTAPIASNVVCFRYNPGGLSEDELNSLNNALAKELDKVNYRMFSDTSVKGRWSLRGAIVNHRSRHDDFDYAVKTVKELGRKARIDLEK